MADLITLSFTWEQLAAMNQLILENAERTKPLVDPGGPLALARKEIDRAMVEDLNRFLLTKREAAANG